MKNLFLSASLAFICAVAHSQNVGINATGASPDASAGLDVAFNSKGLLIPRLALTQTSSAAPVTTPVASLLVYNTATVNDVIPGYYYWDGSVWVRLLIGSGTGSGWLTNGNTLTGTLPSSPNEFIGTTNGADWIVKTNNTEIMRVTSTGLLGVGTTTPQTTQEIYSAGSGLFAGGFPAILRLHAPDDQPYPLLFSNDLAGPTKDYGIWLSTFGDLIISNAAGGGFMENRVVIDSTGNVGIGTSAPQVRMHIVSAIPNTTTNLHPYRTGAIVEGDQNTFGGRISIRQADNVSSLTLFRTNGTIAAPTTLILGDVMGRISFGGHDGTLVNSFFGVNAIAAETWTNVAHGSDLSFNTINMGAGFGGTEKMRITSAGFVGIGTTTPDAEMEVISLQSTMPRGMLSTQYNAAALSDAQIWMRRARGTEATPAAVQSGDELGFIKFRGYGTSFSTNDQTEIGAVASENFSGTANGSYLKFMTTPNGAIAGAERMRIDQNGFVGIGTTGSPANNLQVYQASIGTPVGEMSLDVVSFQTLPNKQASYYFRARDIGAGGTDFFIRGDGMWASGMALLLLWLTLTEQQAQGTTSFG